LCAEKNETIALREISQFLPKKLSMWQIINKRNIDPQIPPVTPAGFYGRQIKPVSIPSMSGPLSMPQTPKTASRNPFYETHRSKKFLSCYYV
jgi:hypothetical protein